MKRILIIAALVIFALSCQEEQLASEKSSSDLMIKTGTICGWCSKNDTLSIIGNSVRYVNYTQCDNSNPVIMKTGEIDAQVLDSLLLFLDYDAFKKIALNSCNICFDGCDNWIEIHTGEESHYIRFIGNEPNLNPIKEFIERLNAIKMTYQ
ncbi:MAG: hypothetical protein ACM3O8_05310 [Methylococcaceae bacterium]|nr:hypothetical protein [Prolixibacteraceae bacterium]